MERTMRAAGTTAKWLLAAAALAAVAACGGTVSGGGVATGGPATLSGGLTGTVTVKGLGQYQSGVGVVVGLNSITAGGPTLGIIMTFPSGTTALSTGTFTAASVAQASIQAYQGNNGYAAVGGTTVSSSDAQGSFTLNVTEVGSALNATVGTQWPFMHGTLTATLPAVSSSAATGTVTISVTF